MSQQTVTINGTVYDAQTGLPVGPSLKSDTQEPIQETQEETRQPTESAHPQPSQSVHRQVQKSQTLNRRVVKKNSAQSTQLRQDIQKSSAITKFAPHPAYNKPGTTRTFSDIGPTTHPMTQKLQPNSSQATAKQAIKPSQVIKQEAIAEAMQKTPSKAEKEKSSKRTQKWQRFASIGSISIALLLLGGYFTYLNMPSISVRVAAAQAGVNATYPEFRPDGYGLSGAVAYSQGQVSMEFAANSGSHSYTINQSKSNWDSSAVKEDVDQKTDGKYIAYNEQGLTIYTYGSNAMWVNGGVLYSIQGNAPLSSDQIRRIATSM